MQQDYRDLEIDTIRNAYYRNVVCTLPNFQLVLMSLKPGEDIPREKHTSTTQFIRVERGEGIAKIGNKTYNLYDGVSLVIPPNKYHYIKNNSQKVLKLCTIYTPPEHKPNTLQKRQSN